MTPGSGPTANQGDTTMCCGSDADKGKMFKAPMRKETSNMKGGKLPVKTNGKASRGKKK